MCPGVLNVLFNVILSSEKLKILNANMSFTIYLYIM